MQRPFLDSLDPEEAVRSRAGGCRIRRSRRRSRSDGFPFASRCRLAETPTPHRDRPRRCRNPRISLASGRRTGLPYGRRRLSRSRMPVPNGPVTQIRSGLHDNCTADSPLIRILIRRIASSSMRLPHGSVVSAASLQDVLRLKPVHRQDRFFARSPSNVSTRLEHAVRMLGRRLTLYEDPVAHSWRGAAPIH